MLRRFWGRIGLLVLGFLLLTGKVEGEETGKQDRFSLIQEKKTLNRKVDPIMVLGEKLKNNLGREIAGMSLLALVDGKLKPVPFQIDEITPEGEWVLPSVPPRLEEKLKKGDIQPEKDADEGILDENDQLVFMVRDAGDRISKDNYPEGVVAVDEIELLDPIDGGKAWVYLCYFAGNPPRSEQKYVEYKFSPENPDGLVINRDAVLGFDPKMSNSPNYMSVWGSENILDRMKIRFKMTFLGLSFTLNETNLVSEMSFYKAGPIRIIRRVRTSVRFTDLFQTPMAAVENLYYDTVQVVPVRIALPLSLKPFSKFMKIKVRGGADYQNLKGWRAKFETDPHWFSIDGKMDEIEKKARGEGAKLFILWGPHGALVYRIVLDRKPDGTRQETPITTDMLYNDCETCEDSLENSRGQVPEFAYWMKNLEKLSKGIFYFYVNQFNIKDYQEGMEKEYLDILDNEIQVYVD